MQEKSKVEMLRDKLLTRLEQMTPGARVMPVRQIMQEYGISQLTVVQALSRLETEGRIARDAGKGYFVRDCSKTDMFRIGFIAPDWPAQSVLEMEEFLKQVAPEFSCTVSRVNYKIGSDLWNNFPYRDFDGLVIIPESDFISVDVLSKAVSSPIPVVFRSVALKDVKVSSVAGDSFAIGGKAAAYLIGKGHRRLALLISEPTSAAVVRDRCEGFRLIAEMAGVELTVIDCQVKSGEYSPEKTYQVMRGWLQDHSLDFSAIFAITDETASATMRAFVEHGIAIPDQISVLGCGGLRQGAYFYPPLTSVTIDPILISRLTIQSVLEQVKDRSCVIKKLVAPEVLERNSVKNMA